MTAGRPVGHISDIKWHNSHKVVELVFQNVDPAMVSQLTKGDTCNPQYQESPEGRLIFIGAVVASNDPVDGTGKNVIRMYVLPSELDRRNSYPGHTRYVLENAETLRDKGDIFTF